MTKDEILSEIKRTAAANGGEPLGSQRFSTETGIGKHDWYGKHWARWSDALREAGLRPNALASAIPETNLLAKLAGLARELGHVPVTGELRLKARSDPQFPSHTTFSRLGKKRSLTEKLRIYCLAQGYEDVAALCAHQAEADDETDHELSPEGESGHVYLLRSGHFYKIGRTNSLGRRGQELAIQLPEPAKVVHSINTDDPSGIEAYWQNRFRDRHQNGEWYKLTPRDVAAFRRRKFM